MEFKRKKKRGINQKSCRLWFSAEGYRITWRKEVFGVTIPPGFQACVRTVVPGCFEGDNTEIWDFVSRDKRLYKTMNAAVTDCEQHQQLWNQATKCTGIRAVQELFGHRPMGIPKWVVTKLDRRVSAILLDTQLGYKDEVEEEPEALKPRVSKKSSSRKPVTSEKSVKKKRKMRSDKGKKRGPRKGIKK